MFKRKKKVPTKPSTKPATKTPALDPNQEARLREAMDKLARFFGMGEEKPVRSQEALLASIAADPTASQLVITVQMPNNGIDDFWFAQRDGTGKFTFHPAPNANPANIQFWKGHYEALLKDMTIHLIGETATSCEFLDRKALCNACDAPASSLA